MSEYVIAGGADPNGVQMVEIESGKVVDKVDTGKTCLCIDTAIEGKLVAIGAADGSLRVNNILMWN